ncbi:MAG: hypothetical protein Kow0069_33170 [Promethearchaeota archaeon]
MGKRKLALVGMQNAGKTSILRLLAREVDQLVDPAPTTGVDREYLDVLGERLVVWDFGGQKTYRDAYLADPARYFSEVSVLFFAFDAKDEALVEEALEYFARVVAAVVQLNPGARFVVLLHKQDPPASKRSSLARQLAERATLTCEELAGRPPDVFDTSIFDAMSVVGAFSRVLLGSGTLYSQVSAVMRRFCEARACQFGVVFSREVLELGNYKREGLEWASIHAELRKFFSIVRENFEEEHVTFESERLCLLCSKFHFDLGSTRLPFYVVVGVDKGVPPDVERATAEALTDLSSDFQKVFGALKPGELVRVTRV